MSKKDKRLSRFLSKPKDYSWEELVTFLADYGFRKRGSGKGVKFTHPEIGVPINIHPPHPGNIVKRVYLKGIKDTLVDAGLIEDTNG